MFGMVWWILGLVWKGYTRTRTLLLNPPTIGSPASTVPRNLKLGFNMVVRQVCPKIAGMPWRYKGAGGSGVMLSTRRGVSVRRTTGWSRVKAIGPDFKSRGRMGSSLFLYAFSGGTSRMPLSEGPGNGWRRLQISAGCLGSFLSGR